MKKRIAAIVSLSVLLFIGGGMIEAKAQTSVADGRRAPLATRGGKTSVQAERLMQMRAASYEPYMRAAARTRGVDPHVLWAIAYLETRFQPNRISPKGARGMMQFMPQTAATYDLADPFDARSAIDAAARYVRVLAARFDNRLDLILAGYNAGEGTVEAYLRGVSIKQSNGKIINPNRLRTGGIPPYTETREYVRRGLFIADYVRATGIFDESKTAASRRPMMLMNEAAKTMATRQQNVPAQMQPAHDDKRNVLLSEMDMQSKTPPTSIYAVRIMTVTPLPPPNTLAPDAASNQQPEPPRSTYTHTPDR
ncbi:MAG: lytic transglycosylase domain-containing protein [Pyrinomonadaceae bacterium MAG19_C2-C3]|nr:lytic transglycosylase domain-containing protein [Pyrinomonadaceae bacterium MAG19_C2-C3]